MSFRSNVLLVMGLALGANCLAVNEETQANKSKAQWLASTRSIKLVPGVLRRIMPPVAGGFAGSMVFDRCFASSTFFSQSDKKAKVVGIMLIALAAVAAHFAADVTLGGLVKGSDKFMAYLNAYRAKAKIGLLKTELEIAQNVEAGAAAVEASAAAQLAQAK